MPKIKDDLVGISGKLGERVYVHSHKYPPHFRSIPKSISKKRLAALKENYARTALLNKLAGEINHIIKKERSYHKPANFYLELQKNFRQQPLNNRYVLLSGLKGIDIHSRYTIEKLGGVHQLTVKPNKQKIKVTLQVKYHPSEYGKLNCYCYELLLISWNKTSNPPKYEWQYSDWIYLKDSKPVFDFSFSRSGGTTNWLLCLMQKMGVDAEEGSHKLQGMQFAEVGSFNKNDEELFKRSQEKKMSTTRKKKMIVRIKPKKFN